MNLREKESLGLIAFFFSKGIKDNGAKFPEDIHVYELYSMLVTLFYSSKFWKERWCKQRLPVNGHQ